MIFIIIIPIIMNKIKFFCRQLEVALKTDYPVVIHSREAEKETIKTLAPFIKKGLKVLLHSFTSSQELADFGIQFDCYFSFTSISIWRV